MQIYLQTFLSFMQSRKSLTRNRVIGCANFLYFPKRILAKSLEKFPREIKCIQKFEKLGY